MIFCSHELRLSSAYWCVSAFDGDYNSAPHFPLDFLRYRSGGAGARFG